MKEGSGMCLAVRDISSDGSFIMIQVAMIRDGQSPRNRRSSVDADSPSMMYLHLQQSLFLLIDISKGDFSGFLFSNAILLPKIFSNPHYFCDFISTD